MGVSNNRDDMGLSKRGVLNRGVTNRSVLNMGRCNNKGQGPVKERCFK
jgi:hypothetical protein